jgi:hypothetical protein
MKHSTVKIILLALTASMASCANTGNHRAANDLGNKFQQCTTNQNIKSQCALQFYYDIQRSLNSNDPIKPAYSKLAMRFYQLFLESEAGKIGNQQALQQRFMAIDYDFRNEIRQVEQREKQNASDVWQKFLDDQNKNLERHNSISSPTPPVTPPNYNCRRIGGNVNCSPY